MRSLDESLTIIERKAHARLDRKTVRRAAMVYGLGICACASLIAGFFITLPKLYGETARMELSTYGSQIVESEAVGYVIIGLLAFVLGVLVTLFCVRLMKYRSRERVGK